MDCSSLPLLILDGHAGLYSSSGFSSSYFLLCSSLDSPVFWSLTYPLLLTLSPALRPVRWSHFRNWRPSGAICIRVFLATLCTLSCESSVIFTGALSSFLSVNCIALVLSGSVSVDFLVEHGSCFPLLGKLILQFVVPTPHLARGHAAACPAGGRGSGTRLTPSRLVLPALLPAPSCLLFSSQSWSPLLPAPGGGPVGHTAAVSPLLARQCWGAALGGSGTPPSVQSHRRPRGCVAAALQARLRDGPPPPASFPCSRAPVVLRLPFLPP